MSKQKQVAVKVEVKDKDSKAQMDKICKGLDTTSAKIRALHAKGYKTGEIARHLQIIYQFARNVINRPLKRAAKS